MKTIHKFNKNKIKYLPRKVGRPTDLPTTQGCPIITLPTTYLSPEILKTERLMDFVAYCISSYI